MPPDKRHHPKSLGDPRSVSPALAPRVLHGAWIQLSRWRKKWERLPARPPKRLTQLRGPLL